MSRRFLLAPLLAAGVMACAARDDTGPTAGSSDDDIIGVPQTAVERDNVGGTWLFAHAAWADQLHRAAAPDGLDPSPSYWAYWHWFDQIASGIGSTIATGGNWETASRLVTKYGLASDAWFLSGGSADGAERERAALATIAASLDSGALSTPVARRDRLIVRRELDRAWGLSPDVVEQLDRVFGDHADKSFTTIGAHADATGTSILRAEDVAVAYASGPQRAKEPHTLADALASFQKARFSGAQRASYLVRIEQAVHDGEPALITWFVDFDALENRETPRLGTFNLVTLGELGPGTQGGHAGVVVDYAVTLGGATGDKGAPVDPSGIVTSLRVKNEWGFARPDRVTTPGMPDHHDLYADYLTGTVQRCVTRDGTTDPSSCPYSQVPLESVVLPPGY